MCHDSGYILEIQFDLKTSALSSPGQEEWSARASCRMHGDGVVHASALTPAGLWSILVWCRLRRRCCSQTDHDLVPPIRCSNPRDSRAPERRVIGDYAGGLT